MRLPWVFVDIRGYLLIVFVIFNWATVESCFVIQINIYL